MRVIICILLSVFPLVASAQSKIGWCRMDGVPGGNVTRGAVGGVCFGGAAAATQRVTDAAVAFSQEAGEPLCPPVDIANAQARCEAAGSSFTPDAFPNVAFTNSDGVVRQERQAIAVKRINSDGACIFSRVVGSATTENGTCGAIFTWPRVEATVQVRTYCGYVCR